MPLDAAHAGFVLGWLILPVGTMLLMLFPPTRWLLRKLVAVLMFVIGMAFFMGHVHDTRD